MKNFLFHCVGKTYAPFSNPLLRGRLEELGFVAANILRSDLLVVRNLSRALVVARLFPLRKVLVWTHEPVFDLTEFALVPAFPGKAVHVLNVFTGDVFWHNRHFLGSYHYDDSIDLGLTRGVELGEEMLPREEDWNKRRLAVAVYARKRVDECGLILQGRNIDLSCYREDLALIGKKRGFCDIVGRGWDGDSIEDSGFDGNDSGTPWWTRKIQLMAGYRFNLAFENTNWPYYVTEKIWQSIRAGCLPIYWGRDSSIYESFEPDSFVDSANFESSENLWQWLSEMSYDEWRSRMLRSINCYNREMRVSVKQGFPHLSETLGRVRVALSTST